jgi:Arc/MetJ family transcription regulator
VTAGQLAFATPADWFPVRLPRTQADIDRLAADVMDAYPVLAGERDTVQTMLRGFGLAAAAIHALCARAAVAGRSDLALPATLLVSLQAMGGHTLDQVAGELSEGTLAPSAVTMFNLPAGRTARVERLSKMPNAVAGRSLAWLSVNYVTKVPDHGQAIVLTFGTLAVAQARSLLPVFHQIACSLCVNPAGRVQPPGRPQVSRPGLAGGR